MDPRKLEEALNVLQDPLDQPNDLFMAQTEQVLLDTKNLWDQPKKYGSWNSNHVFLSPSRSTRFELDSNQGNSPPKSNCALSAQSNVRGNHHDLQAPHDSNTTPLASTPFKSDQRRDKTESPTDQQQTTIQSSISTLSNTLTEFEDNTDKDVESRKRKFSFSESGLSETPFQVDFSKWTCYKLQQTVRIPRGIPQSVTFLPQTEEMLISDVDCNVIHKFKGDEYQGHWAKKFRFQLPRHIVCQVRSPDNRKENRRKEAKLDRFEDQEVFVLDISGIFKFSSAGEIIWRGYMCQAQCFRGFTLCTLNGVSCLTTVEVTTCFKVLFLSTDEPDKILKSVVVNVSGLDESDLLRSKVRGIVVGEGVAYFTDVYLGCIFMVNLMSGCAKKILIDSPMGLTRDTYGNILVASLNRNVVEVFCSQGYFERRLALGNIGMPSEIILNGNDIIIVDFQTSAIRTFRNVAE